MRILLTSGASYAPPRGGSSRSNLFWLRALVAKGHTCRVVCSASTEAGETTVDGISIQRIPDLPLHAEKLTEEIRAFRPDWVLVSSEDVTQRLLRAAERAALGRLVYLAHTPQFFPFGPESWNPDPEAARIVQRAAGVIAIGHHMAAYIRSHLQTIPTVIHPPVYGAPPFRQFQPFDAEFVLMINPCIVKGIEIFASLAQHLPETKFAALLGWGTTSQDRRTLAAHPNIELLPNVPNIETVLARAKLLLMPSLWYEGFGLIVMEAMLRGLPVVSSNSGGLLEAKHGTGYILPVNPVERYEPVFDENHMPRPIRAAQNIAPWVDAVTTLTTNREAHRRESETSRSSALVFVNALNPDSLEQYLLQLKPRLTDAQRQLLLKRLKPA